MNEDDLAYSEQTLDMKLDHPGIFVHVKSILRNNQQATYGIRNHSTGPSCRQKKKKKKSNGEGKHDN